MQIKFRGMDAEGVWHYGYYFCGNDSMTHKIIRSDESWVEVRAETVGQFTNWHDKNKAEIYLGMELVIPDTCTDSILDGGGGLSEDFIHIAVVDFKEGGFGVEIKDGGDCLSARWYPLSEIDFEISFEDIEIYNDGQIQ